MAAYVGHYITQALLERRFSVAAIRRAYDDNNDGAADSDAVSQLIQDAEAMFEGYCRGIYDLAALRTAKPNEAIRLCLDCANFMAAQRFPRALNKDWTQIEASVTAQLKGLRRGDTRLDIMGSPEPAANQGGYVSSGDVNLPEVRPATFTGQWGSF